MAISLQDLTNDPSLFLFEYEGDDAVFQTMTREAFERSIFLDGRIRHGDRPRVRVPLNQLLGAWPDIPPSERRIGWIFHVAQCGSTLLARALDHPGRSLVLREPLALRRLGVMAGGGESGERFQRMLRVTMTSLGKRWDAQAPVVVKANVPVNFIAHQVLRLDPEAPAIALHFPLESYAAAILRTEGHQRWTATVFEELRLGDSPYAADHAPDSTARQAAALWFAQMKVYEGIIADFPAVRSLDAGVFFAEPAATIAAAAELFDVQLRPGEADEIASGELFQSYSKNPALDYDPEVREAREKEARGRLAAEIAEAVEWALAAKERHGLPDALASPLVGEPVPLLP